MAHFVKIENGIVTNGIVINNDVVGEPTLTFPDTESLGQAFIADTLKFDGTWIQTSYNSNFRKHYAGIGYVYDAIADVFVTPKSFPSWTLNSNNDWQPPTPKPEGDYYWNEAELAWVAIQLGENNDNN